MNSDKDKIAKKEEREIKAMVENIELIKNAFGAM